MTLTTEVRINWPVPAVRLLDHVTEVAGGNPATVRRRVWDPSEYGRHGINNQAGQGLRTLACVSWSEQLDTGDEGDFPPALVVLSIDNPYGYLDHSTGEDLTGRTVQATTILPAVVEWLDDHGVPRDRWWWEDETAGTWHPGTVDVSHLATDEPRDEWRPTVRSSSGE